MWFGATWSIAVGGASGGRNRLASDGCGRNGSRRDAIGSHRSINRWRGVIASGWERGWARMAGQRPNNRPVTAHCGRRSEPFAAIGPHRHNVPNQGVTVPTCAMVVVCPPAGSGTASSTTTVLPTGPMYSNAHRTAARAQGARRRDGRSNRPGGHSYGVGVGSGVGGTGLGVGSGVGVGGSGVGVGAAVDGTGVGVATGADGRAVAVGVPFADADGDGVAAPVDDLADADGRLVALLGRGVGWWLAPGANDGSPD